MIRFAQLVAQGAPQPQTFAAYQAQVGAEDGAAALRLLCGQRPKRLAPPATLLDWVAQATDTPAFLIAACLKTCPDKAELAALLLPPPPQGPTPTLTEALASLTSAPAYLALARPLPPEARTILNRLATGTFRTKLAQAATGPQTAGQCLAILTLIDPSGPEATFALPHGNALVPLTRLRLTLPQTPALLAWVRAHVTDRFGPLRQVPPTQVFELAFDGITPNARRKSGIDLVGGRVIAWAQDTQGADVPPLSALLAQHT
ncbi:MAG: hypothetical protein WCO04_00595 [Pseudomonadota bacterium]